MRILSEATPKLPMWMQARAARYIRIRKRGSHKKNRNNNIDPETTSIIKLYRSAVNSAAFIVVGCHVLGLNILSHAKSFDHMPSYLIGPDKDMDCTHLPESVVEAGSVKFSFLKCETEARESYIDSTDGHDEKGKDDDKSNQHDDKTDGDNETTKDQSDTKVNVEETTCIDANQSQEANNTVDTNINIPSPLLGWNETLDISEYNQEWRDPRMCVLCHTCGDDDADFASDDCYINPSDDNVSTTTETSTTKENDFQLSDIGKCGRLLPFLQNGQTSWVHTGMLTEIFIAECLYYFWTNSMRTLELRSVGE